MLTKRQNLLETIRGGHPDRYVNQFEFVKLFIGTPYMAHNPMPAPGQMNVTNAWGITFNWPEGHPGMFPNHAPDKVVIKDIERWREYVKVPNVVYDEKDWEPIVAQVEAVDRSEYFVAPWVLPGLFEQCHHHLEISNALMAFYEYPDEMHELIDTFTEFELAYAAEICKYMKPDALFHHDDWGSQQSTFISPDMFREFFKPAYTKIYNYYKEHGVELIIHHSDSYAATLVPDMIDMGIDIWQGVMTTNNIPELIKQYGGQISFMGGIDSGKIDRKNWTREKIRAEAEQACADCGTKYFIPCNTMGEPGSIFPGVYDTLTEEIAEISKKYF